MSKCVDTHIGKLLHDYEMGWLSDNERERFEMHLMECPYCFEEVRQFRHAAELLSEDETVRAAVAGAVEDVEREVTFWQRVRDLFWPKTNVLLKPAFVYLLIVLLLPLVYRGISHRQPGGDRVRAVRMIDLVSTRGPLQTVRPQAGDDLVLNFGYEAAIPDRQYRVLLKSEKQDTMYLNAGFGFDRRQAARLIVPHTLLSPGEYLLVIEDSTDTLMPGGDTLRFRVEY
jgi:hypothetical protein